MYYDDLNEWELFDLERDPDEQTNLFGPEHAALARSLRERLLDLAGRYDDELSLPPIEP